MTGVFLGMPLVWGVMPQAILLSRKALTIVLTLGAAGTLVGIGVMLFWLNPTLAAFTMIPMPLVIAATASRCTCRTFRKCY